MEPSRELSESRLKELYYNLDLEINDILNILNIRESKLYRYLTYYNLPRRQNLEKENIIGKKYGKLIAIKSLDKSVFHNRKRTMIQWKCECGNIVEYAKDKIIYRKNPSCGCNNQKGKNNSAWKGIEELSGEYYCSIKCSAKDRKLEFNITKEYIWNLFLEQERKCALSGIELIMPNKYNKIEDNEASLDRIDSTQGYIEGNVQWIHKDIQNMKMNKKQDYFILWCKRIANYADISSKSCA